MSEQLAREFVETYYLTLQKKKEDLLQFYTEDSIMSFEGNHNKGLKEIAERIEQLSYTSVTFFPLFTLLISLQIKHEVVTMDAHPSLVPNGILITVTGNMQTDEDAPHKFVQVFHVVPNNNGGYYCKNNNRLTVV